MRVIFELFLTLKLVTVHFDSSLTPETHPSPLVFLIWRFLIRLTGIWVEENLIPLVALLLDLWYEMVYRWLLIPRSNLECSRLKFMLLWHGPSTLVECHQFHQYAESSLSANWLQVKIWFNVYGPMSAGKQSISTSDSFAAVVLEIRTYVIPFKAIAWLRCLFCCYALKIIMGRKHLLGSAGSVPWSIITL